MKQYEYDIIVLGGGAAGLVACVHAKGLNKRVLLVDQHKRPQASKFVHDVQINSLIKYIGDIEAARLIQPFGVKVADSIRTSSLLEGIRKKRDVVSRFSSLSEIENMGITTVCGKGSFSDNHTVTVGSRSYSARSVIVAAGSEAIIPDVEGLTGDHVLLPADLFAQPSLPKSLCILGAGPSGCQFASALALLGCKVVLLDQEEKILPREDRECAEIIQKMLESRGVMLFTGAQLSQVERAGGKCSVRFLSNEKKRKLSVEKVLLCCGREAAVNSLGFENAGIDAGPSGVTVNSYLQTSVPNIFACGDITGPYYLTSRAEKQGALAAVNASGSRKQKILYDDPVWSLSLLPDLSRFGLTEHEALARYGQYGVKVYKFPYKYSMNAVIRDSSEGYAKIICRKKGQIIGAHIIGENSRELISRLYQARKNNINFARLSFQDYIFPSYADVIAKPSLRAYVEQQTGSLAGGFFSALMPHRK